MTFVNDCEWESCVSCQPLFTQNAQTLEELQELCLAIFV